MKDNLDRKIIIFNKYQPIKLIHSSGFGDVYEGKNIKENIPVAIKVERKNSKFNMLESEAFFLMNLKGFGIPKIITYGHYFKYNVLIEELLGKSIENIYDIKKYDNFSIKDVCMIALQSLDRLEYIHSKFFIHRDIKPQNFVIGRNDPDVIYLIDFGLSRKYRSSRTNKHIKFKNLKLTYGSLRYLSINGNCGYEQSRRDDLESLGYMLIYLSTGTLPWILFESENIDVVKKYLRTHKLKKK
jgi:serine/threonine protein kinase